MDDLVKRLRETQYDHALVVIGILREAADEIERLRSCLSDIEKTKMLSVAHDIATEGLQGPTR